MPAIICRHCGKSNLPEKRFCVECGQRLARSCAACGEPIAAGEKFCGNCGVRLEAEPPRREHDTPVDSQPAGERRHLTVLFADLVSSTQLATRLDPEEYHLIVQAYHQAVERVVTRLTAMSPSTKVMGSSHISDGRGRTATTRNGRCALASRSWKRSSQSIAVCPRADRSQCGSVSILGP